MKPLAAYLVETLACSGVLTLLYHLLLDRRVGFRWCRAYLLLAAPAAALIPALRIPVWPGEVVMLRLEEGLPTWDTLTALTTEAPAAAAPFPLSELLCTLLYAAGVAVLAAVIVRQIVEVRRLRRGATVDKRAHYTLVRTPRRIASFSLFGSIYVWQQTPEHDLGVILAHEASHIAHRHSVERLAMESIKALLWWNPFVWVMARRLAEVEEYEADSDVLGAGHDRAGYMTAIFRQLYGYSPDIATGLGDSLIKKRLLMMTRNTSGRHTLLRLAATAPVLMGLLCAFSFSARATRYITPDTVALSDDRFVAATAPADSVATRTGDQPYLTAEVMPHFEGRSLNHFRLWIMDNLDYPRTALDEGVEGRVVVSFIIERDGSVNGIEVLQSPDKRLADAAVGAIARSPKWTPGRQHGEPVRVKYTLPVDFKSTAPEADKTATEVVTLTGNGTRPKENKTTTEVSTEVVSLTGYGTRPKEESPAAARQEEELPFLTAETMPLFEGRDLNHFRMWVMNRIDYPRTALDEGIEGRVTVTFIIERDGSVGEINILQSPDARLTDEAVRIISQSPKWSPGMQKGKHVRIRYTMPVDFRIEATAAAEEPAAGQAQ